MAVPADGGWVTAALLGIEVTEGATAVVGEGGSVTAARPGVEVTTGAVVATGEGGSVTAALQGVEVATGAAVTAALVAAVTADVWRTVAPGEAGEGSGRTATVVQPARSRADAAATIARMLLCKIPPVTGWSPQGRQ